MNELLARILGRAPVFAPHGDGAGGGAASGDGAGAASGSAVVGAGGDGKPAAGAGEGAGADDAKPKADAAPAKTDEPAKVEGGVLGDDPAKAAAETPEAKAAREKTEADAKAAKETPEAKAAREKTEKEAADKKKADEAKAAKEAKVPKDGYTLDTKALALPDGMEIDATAKAAFDPVAKEIGLDQTEYTAVAKVFATIKANELAQFVDTVKSWEAAGKADPEIGGAKYDETVANARLALKEFGTEKLREALFYSGYGNHLELLRCFSSVGEALKSGQGVRRKSGSDGRSLAERLYPPETA